jgi:hypothetical protein
MVIKKGHPIVRVSVYDSVETETKSLSCPQGRRRLPKAAGAMSAFLVQLLMARLNFSENGDVVGHRTRCGMLPTWRRDDGKFVR